MKKKLLFLFSLISINTFACSCCYFTTTFCGNVRDAPNVMVALLEVQEFAVEEPYQQIMIAKVVDDLFNNIDLDTITVFGSDGGNCNDNFSFGVKDTILMQIYEGIDLEDTIRADRIYQNGGCGISFLKYNKNTLYGSIMPEVEEMPYNNFVDNISECQSSPSFISIYGTISSWKEEDKGVQIDDLSINGFPLEEIDTNGYYHFQYVELTQYTEHKLLEPYSNGDVLKGVSISDVLKIQRHILGLEELENPWQMVAADVNNSGSITVLDILEIRKIILGLQDNFNNNTSWRFTEKDYIFQSQFPLKENFDAKISIDACSDEAYNVNLIAIKIGDVNGDFLNN